MANQPRKESRLAELERRLADRESQIKAQQAEDEKIDRLIRERAAGPDRLSTILAAYDVLTELGNAGAAAAAEDGPAQTATAVEPAPAPEPIAPPPITPIPPRLEPDLFEMARAWSPLPETQPSLGARVMRGADQFVRSVARGIPAIGTGMEEFAAAADATVGPLVGRGSQREGWSNRYHENLATERARDREFDENYPVTSNVGKAAGAILGTLAGARGLPAVGVRLPTPAPTFAGRMGQYTVAGAAIGAPTGFLAGENDLRNRIIEALLDAGIGAVAAPTFGATVEGAAVLARHGGQFMRHLNGRAVAGQSRAPGSAASEQPSPKPPLEVETARSANPDIVSSGNFVGAVPKEAVDALQAAKREAANANATLPAPSTPKALDEVAEEQNRLLIGKAPHVKRFDYQPPLDFHLSWGNPLAEPLVANQVVLPFPRSTAPVAPQSARAFEQMGMSYSR